jgi:phosphomannomutase/phosphoglucomutase
LDGVRVDYDNGWGLVRASNTSPKLTLRFEADSEEDLSQIKAAFASALQEQGIAF